MHCAVLVVADLTVRCLPQSLLQHTVHVVGQQSGVPDVQPRLSEHLQQGISQLPQFQ